MQRKFACIYPCKSSFKDETSLRRHYQHVPACKWRWNQETDLTAKQFEQASERRRAEMRNDAVDDSEMVDHAVWELESNDADNTSQRDGQSNNTGSDSAGPLDRRQASGDSDLAATADFEESLYGPTQGGPTTSGSDDPYLDTADVDLEEGQPGYVPAPDDTDQLGDILEGVQLGADDAEDLDPSEVEQFPRAGEIKDPELRTRSRFETLYEEARGNPFYPFRGAAEFELVKWLNGLPLSKVDSFLQLDWVSRV
jgi:hypothetical protein